MKNNKKIAAEDLEHILENTKDLWHNAQNQTFFVTGGTGFFGKWLLESFLFINQKLSLNARLYVLSRDPEGFLSLYPQFNHTAIQFVKGDILSFPFPDYPIDYIIHAATEASVSLNLSQPLLMFDTIVSGTRHILELARIKNVKAILHTTSGAVYGEQPPHVTHITEDSKSCPDIFLANAAYGEGKRVAEMFSNLYFNNYGVNSKIARCFAFVGPYLPLDSHFAIGNFINDLLNNRAINIKGDGTPYRSYLYASDLVIWLWHILFKGKTCMPYNVGSDEDITIADLAKTISNFSFGNTPVYIGGVPDKDKRPQRYVPNIERAEQLLNLKVHIPLKTAIRKTIDYYSE